MEMTVDKQQILTLEQFQYNHRQYF